jgi:murein DD-endopeptidase MepM/ murein hydrolase activator NlpD
MLRLALLISATGLLIAGPAAAAGRADVAALQVALRSHGLYSGDVDGLRGPDTEEALVSFQERVGLVPDGIAGPRTMAALRRPLSTSPLDLNAPVIAPLGDRFGPRGDAFHAGVDFVAPAGTPVVSARAGRVVWAAALGSFGNAVVIRHGRGVRTLYAHLSRIDVGLLERVSTGTQLGLVGSTGHSTGPHLHFEVRVRSAAVDPLGALD